MASAPAERSSSTVSSTEFTSTGRGPSVTVSRMPGPVTGTQPAMMLSSSACFWAAVDGGVLGLLALLEPLPGSPRAG